MIDLRGSVTELDGRRLAAEEFREFVASRSSALLRAGWLLTGDWAAAEDLAQTALAAAWPRWAKLRPDTTEAYVRKVMLTTYLRWKRRRWSGEIATETLPDIPGPDATGDVELRESLRAALDDLSPQQRAAVVLRYFLDLSEADAAEALNCSTGSIKTHTSRALTRLRGHASLTHLFDEGDAR